MNLQLEQTQIINDMAYALRMMKANLARYEESMDMYGNGCFNSAIKEEAITATDEALKRHDNYIKHLINPIN